VPHLTRVLETALDVDDLAVSTDFYHRILGLEIIERGERLCAFAVGRGDVLLLFQREQAAKGLDFAGGMIPPHGSQGSIHFAFAIDDGELPRWEQHLVDNQIVIESRVKWERGGTSIYFRDRDGHLVELATPGIWSIY
jgi:catechol 2,3-dioxygenase-like lactoylglutathione lyase family enzyme